MKTAIYVDGYNLYYGRLKGTPYKWLNLPALVKLVVHVQEPKNQIISCRYYTGMAKGRLASHGERSVQAQNVYHSALKNHPGQPRIEVIGSEHHLNKKPLMRVVEGRLPKKTDRVMVWAPSEKQTDVRIALDAYRAASQKTVEQIVLVTNDSDLEPLVEPIKHDFPKIRRGVICPRRADGGREPPKGFIDNCHWVRRHIRNDELAQCQFPRSIPTRRKPAIRPDHWNPACFFRDAKGWFKYFSL